MLPALILTLAMQALADAPAASGAPPQSPAERRIEDHNRLLTGAVTQGMYEAGVKGASSRSQSLQGPLDGTWILKDGAGLSLYRFQLVDPGFSGGQLEGAWSDLQAGTGADSSGFFTGVAREGARVTFQFVRAGAGPMTAALDLRGDGLYAGELRSAAAGRQDQRQAVVLARP